MATQATAQKQTNTNAINKLASTVFERYKKYANDIERNEAGTPCSFFEWLTDGIDNSFSHKMAHEILDILGLDYHFNIYYEG